MVNYKVLFWVSIVIIVLLVAYLLSIKRKVDQVKGVIGDIERAFYEMNGYIREAIVGGITENLKSQFEYSVDKLADAIKLRYPKFNIDKLSSLKQVFDGDISTIATNVATALNVSESKVLNFLSAIKSQIQNHKAGQSIATSINHEDANTALGEIISTIRNNIN